MARSAALQIGMGYEPVVDAHVHAFPDERAGRQWQAAVGIAEPKRTGAIAELSRLMREGGITHAFLLLIPRTRETFRLLRDESPDISDQVLRSSIRDGITTLNRWGCDLGKRDSRFLPFIGIDVQFMTEHEVVSEVEYGYDNGAAGVKIIPPMMELYPNDPRLLPLFQTCWDLDLPLLSQSGSGGMERAASDVDPYGRPRYFEEPLRNFPGLRLILAHMSTGFEEELISLASKYPNLYTDTSLRLSGLGKPGRWSAQQLVDTVRRIGIERVLLGSNYPMTNTAVYAKIIAELPFDEEERRRLRGGNAKELFAARRAGSEAELGQ